MIYIDISGPGVWSLSTMNSAAFPKDMTAKNRLVRMGSPGSFLFCGRNRWSMPGVFCPTIRLKKTWNKNCLKFRLLGISVQVNVWKKSISGWFPPVQSILKKVFKQDGCQSWSMAAVSVSVWYYSNSYSIHIIYYIYIYIYACVRVVIYIYTHRAREREKHWSYTFILDRRVIYI